MSAGYLGKCARKRRHETKEAAQAHRGSMVARKLWTLRTSKVYPCNVCGGFHTGRVGSANRARG